jgi:DNA polymerase-3 subunit alpha (Gram-positive type)
MSFLISKGLEGHDAFVIMEAVRKGKKLKDDQVQLMREHDVPEYYIQSCNKIAYLFPKGHACAYVMMALRVGYYKVYYPLEFYATFFTLRADQYDIKSMVGGIDAIHKKLVEFDERKKTNNPEFALSKKEEDQEATLIVALEMCERGFKFENIDIEKSDGINFIVDKEHNALIPPFKVIDGFGEKAAEVLIEARKEKAFISKEDLQTRGKVSAAQMKILEDLHVLDELRDNNQMSLFDFSF